jgi:hypothetical protein
MAQLCHRERLEIRCVRNDSPPDAL